MRARGALWLVLAVCTAALRAQADPPVLRVGPVEGDIAARVHENAAALERCRSMPGVPRIALARVRRVVLPIGYGNDVQDVRLEPVDATLEPFRACLLPIVRRWQIGRPETHQPAEVVVEGADLQRILLGR